MVVHAPWLGSEAAAVDLFTPAVVPAHPAALALALVLERLQQAAPVRIAFATLLEPASEFGRAALDELHQQTISLLSFQGLPRELYDAQAAYNLLSGLGEAAKVSLGAVEARVRRHYAALSPGRWPALALQVVHAPVFHGHTFSIAIELEQPAELAAARRGSERRPRGPGSRRHRFALQPGRYWPERCAGPAASRAERPQPDLVSRLWIWAASDNLRLQAQNAVECALDLRRLRPQGTVQ